MVGGSDAGAHLDRMCGSNYPTSFLGDCLRKRKLVPLERAVQLMTEAPAELFGLHDRGRVAEGLCRRPVRLRSRDRRIGAGHPGPRPARRQPPADRRRHRCGAGPGQRGRDRRRRQAHRQPPRHPAPVGPGHRHRRPVPGRGLTARRTGRRAHRPATRRPSHAARPHDLPFRHRRPTLLTQASDPPRPTTAKGDPPWALRSPRTRHSCSSGASGSRPATAPTTSSTRPPSRWSARPPTPRSTTPTPPPPPPGRPSRPGPPPRSTSGWPS